MLTIFVAIQFIKSDLWKLSLSTVKWTCGINVNDNLNSIWTFNIKNRIILSEYIFNFLQWYGENDFTNIKKWIDSKLIVIQKIILIKQNKTASVFVVNNV